MNDIFASLISTLSDPSKGVFDFGGFLLSIMWIILIVYIIISIVLSIKTLKDARIRYNDKFLVFTFVLFVFIFNAFGYIVYSLVKPKNIIHEQQVNRLEKYFLEYETRGIGKCRVCGQLYFPEHNFCTSCGTIVRAKCSNCDNIIELDWKICAYCGDQKHVNTTEKVDKHKK